MASPRCLAFSRGNGINWDLMSQTSSRYLRLFHMAFEFQKNLESENQKIKQNQVFYKTLHA